jgi:hypothetical protein
MEPLIFAKEIIHQNAAELEPTEKIEMMKNSMRAGIQPLDLLLIFLLILDPGRVNQSIYNISAKGEAML